MAPGRHVQSAPPGVVLLVVGSSRIVWVGAAVVVAEVSPEGRAGAAMTAGAAVAWGWG